MAARGAHERRVYDITFALFMVSVTEIAIAGCVISQSSQFFRGAL